MVADAGFDDRGADRLDNVVDRAERQAFCFFSNIVARRDENDRDVFGSRVRLEAGADFISVHSRHVDVQQDQIDLFRLRHLQTGQAIRCGKDRIVVLQQGFHDFQIEPGIVDDQNGTGRIVHKTPQMQKLVIRIHKKEG